jgi:hypothetical protein
MLKNPKIFKKLLETHIGLFNGARICLSSIEWYMDFDGFTTWLLTIVDQMGLSSQK